MSTETMEVRIGLLVGSNRKSAAMPLENIDWGLLADCIMDGSKDPEAAHKHIVTVTVEVPHLDEVANPKVEPA